MRNSISIIELLGKAKLAIGEGRSEVGVALVQVAMEILDDQDFRSTLRTGAWQPAAKPLGQQLSLGGSAITSAVTFAEIYVLSCEYLRSLQIGQKLSFDDLADYIQSRPGVKLDKRTTPTDRRPRWRKLVTDCIEKLRKRGYLVKADKNCWYRVQRHP